MKVEYGSQNSERPRRRVVPEEELPVVEAVGQVARERRADEVEGAHHRQHAGGRHGGQAVVAAERDEVRLHQAVGAEAADEEGAGQDPERRLRDRFAQHGERAEEVHRHRRAGRRRGRRAPSASSPKGTRPTDLRAVLHEQEDQEGDDHAGREHRQHRIAPADVLDQPGRDRQEDAAGRSPCSRRAGRRPGRGGP